MKLVIVRFADGSLWKGRSSDVNPQRPACHLRLESGATMDVPLERLKALFFVRSMEGNPDHQELKVATPGDSRLIGTRCVRLVFHDGEEMIGFMNRFPPNTHFFYFNPIDPGSNNIRILANRAAVAEMAELTSVPTAA